MLKFRCHHCGFCCFETSTQINITLGDIKRISLFLGKSVKELFEKNIGIHPFQRSDSIFDFELGLNIPCTFRKNNRCTIYDARPLNCRIFPFWILGNAPADKMKSLFHPDNKCLLGYGKKSRKYYKKYADAVGKILLEESRITDEFFSRNNLASFVDLSHLVKCGDKENDRKTISLCEGLIDKKRYGKVAVLASEEIRKKKFADLSEINKAEKIIA